MDVGFGLELKGEHAGKVRPILVSGLVLPGETVDMLMEFTNDE